MNYLLHFPRLVQNINYNVFVHTSLLFEVYYLYYVNSSFTKIYNKRQSSKYLYLNGLVYDIMREI